MIFQPIDCPKCGPDKEVKVIFFPRPGRTYAVFKLSCGHTVRFAEEDSIWPQD